MTQVPYPKGISGAVEDLRIARDGARVVLAAAGQAYLTTLSGGRLASPLALAPAVAGVHQVGWQDATDIALVASPTGRPPALVTVSIDGSSVDEVALPSAVGGAVSLASGPGLPLLVAGAGSVEELTGENGWRRVASGDRPGIP